MCEKYVILQFVLNLVNLLDKEVMSKNFICIANSNIEMGMSYIFLGYSCRPKSGITI